MSCENNCHQLRLPRAKNTGDAFVFISFLQRMLDVQKRFGESIPHIYVSVCARLTSFPMIVPPAHIFQKGTLSIKSTAQLFKPEPLQSNPVYERHSLNRRLVPIVGVPQPEKINVTLHKPEQVHHPSQPVSQPLTVHSEPSKGLLTDPQEDKFLRFCVFCNWPSVGVSPIWICLIFCLLPSFELIGKGKWT